MPVTQIGPFATHKALATASFTFTPQEPYAAVIQKITMTGVSAADTWILSINGKELARWYELTVGGQQLLSSSDVNYPKTYNIFTYLDDVAGINLIYPVPQGAVLTLASVGGATADIFVEYQELFPAEVSQGMLNHPNGNHFIMPFYAYVNASLTAAGEYDFDTEVKPNWVPSMFIEKGLIAGWQYRILCLFAQGVGVNTYSGSADHQSVTDHLYLLKSGQRMFTRDVGDGLPVVGVPSAAGSVNTVYGERLGLLHSFQQEAPFDLAAFGDAMMIRTGEPLEWGLGFTGSFTGGAAYATAVVAAMVDVVQTGIAA